MSVKIKRVKEYWSSMSLLIPNVFKVLSEIEEDDRYVSEFQDLSSKTVLVQGQGTKVSSEVEVETQLTRGRSSKRERKR